MDKLNHYGISFALSVALLGCTTQAADAPDPATSQVSRLPVDARIARADHLIQEERVAGSVLANKEVTIASEVPKKVRSIHFTEGSYVGKGQLLYKLEDDEVRARLKQVQAALALARLTESRLARLLKNESVRQEEYDVAQANLQSLEASEELIRIELEKTSITAPFDGVIGITKAEVGTLVNPGEALATLQEQRTVKIQFTVAEKYLPYVRPGKEIAFTVAGAPGKSAARISATESGIDPQTRTITVHALTSNRDGSIKPGMSASVYLSTAEADARGITLPTESLIPGGSGYNVFKVKNGLARITSVTVGNRNESEALITSGLNDGDTVMVSNILRAGDGTPVEIVTIK